MMQISKKIQTEADKIKDIKHKTENHEHENILKTPKIDSEYHRKK